MTSSHSEVLVRKTPPFVVPLSVIRLPLALKLAAKAQASTSSTGALLQDKFSKAVFRLLHRKLNLPARGIMELNTPDGPKRLPFDARNTHYQGVFLTGLELGYEASTLALLDILTADNGVFYDVGGNFGYFSLCLAARPGYGGHIHTFEPHPMSFAELQAHINASGLKARITPHAIALSNENGTGRLRIDALHSALAKLMDGAAGVDVPLKQLDSLDLPPPSVIKIDVEDHEVAVLEGGQRLLKETRPAILFESLRGAPLGATFKPFDFLEGLDFRFYVPAWHLEDQENSFCVSEPSALNLQNRMPHFALLPFDRHNRFLLGDNLNILAWPREKEDALRQLVSGRSEE